MTACGVEAAGGSQPTLVTATVTNTALPTRTPVPATSTPVSASPTPTRLVATSTPTATRTKVSTPPEKSIAVVKATPEIAAQTVATKAVTQVKVSQTTLTLPTYPIADYLVEQLDPVYNMPVFYFNRPEFEAAAPTPTPVDYTGVVLENAYLRLTFLPELGGRLYSAVVKATGQEIFYHNPVVKPSRYGVLEPYEANWWLATGGMEWAYPTQEHGYRWGVPWDYQVEQSADAATITLSDMAPGRVGVEVSVTLPADSAVFTVTPKLVNAGAKTVPVQFWLNAALTLAPRSMSPETRFVVPVDEITVHSRGEEGWTLPDARGKAPWPLVGEIDLQDYSQWANYLGFFLPDLAAPFMGAYNPESDLGVIRLIDPGQVPGSKLFAFGRTFPDRSYTDNDSQYFEIWGGANAGFWPEDDIPVAKGGVLQWQERWWPVAGLGGLTWASPDVAIDIKQTGSRYNLAILVSRPRPATVTVLAAETPILAESFSAEPATPLQWQFTTAAPVRVQIQDDVGKILLDYCPEC